VITLVRSRRILGILVVLASCPALSGRPARAEEPPAGTLPERPEAIEFAPLDFKVPEAKQFRRTLADGTVVYVAPSHEFPLVTVSITFKGGSSLDPAEVPGLVAATARNKSIAKAWIDSMDTRGGTDPSRALDFSLKLRPETIFMMTDGQFLSNEYVNQVIDQENVGRYTSINTIAFHERAAEADLALALLRQARQLLRPARCCAADAQPRRAAQHARHARPRAHGPGQR